MNKYMKKKASWEMVLLALVIGMFVGYSIHKARVQGRMESTISVVRQQLDSAKRRLHQYGIRDEDTVKKDEDIMMTVMNDTMSKKVMLSGVNGTRATGEAYVLRKTDILSVAMMSKLSDPTNGAFYEAWLVNNKVKPMQYVALGRLMKQEDGTWGVTYTSSSPYEDYNMVVVTLERTDDKVAEGHIQEGIVR